MAIGSSVQGSGTEALLSGPGGLLKNTTDIISKHRKVRSTDVD